MRTKLAKIALTAALMLATAFTLSCSDGNDGGSGNNGGSPIKKDKITGVSQKGPFVEGSSATLYELDGDFSQTGRQFFDIIADNKGTFEIKNVELISPYAVLAADGFYRNEVTGQVSTAPIKLYAIADVREKDNVNVNLLTHLEYYRVLNLVENSGKSVAEAKKQAQKEILAVFGIDSDGFKNSEDMSIFGTSDADAALLAISVMLQGNLSEGEFSQRLTNFAQGIKENGVWSNEAAKTAMADWAFGADLTSIRNGILGWGLSSEVPGFGKYTNDYLTSNYGLEECNSSNNRKISESNRNVNAVCKNGFWKKATDRDEYCSANGCIDFVDARDGKEYVGVEIGGQTWMADNLKYNAEGSRCGSNDPARCDEYGQLYTWEMAKTACPDGWHLPTKEEWETLVDFAGGESEAGTKLTRLGGTDEFNFNAEWPFWSATIYDAKATSFCLIPDYTVFLCELSTTDMYKVRCIQD